MPVGNDRGRKALRIETHSFAPPPTFASHRHNETYKLGTAAPRGALRVVMGDADEGASASLRGVSDRHRSLNLAEALNVFR